MVERFLFFFEKFTGILNNKFYYYVFQRANAFGTIGHVLNGHKDRVNCVKWIPQTSYGKLGVW